LLAGAVGSSGAAITSKNLNGTITIPSERRH
jgi:hypothetical protein